MKISYPSLAAGVLAGVVAVVLTVLVISSLQKDVEYDGLLLLFGKVV